MTEPFAYDTVAYPSFVFPHIRPDRIAAIAAVHGIAPTPIDKCRVLELGCGDGANLLSIAHSMPQSECVGLDLSIERIKDSRRIAERLSITNAAFFQQDVMDFEPAKFGEFDLIIAHGLFSWVPDFVREKVLEIYSSCLTPSGIGYISYNTYPGWHLRGIVRDAMQFQTSSISDPMQKVESAVGFIHFLAQAAPEDSLYKRLLEDELKLTSDRNITSFYHDDMADVNKPFYFTEFAEQIGAFGLQFVAESEPVSAFEHRFPPFARQALDKLWNDPVRREQYIDFLSCRRFRSSLICKAEARPDYRPSGKHIGSLWISGEVRTVEPSANTLDDSSVNFTSQKDTVFDLNHPFPKTALRTIGERWPGRISISELIDETRRALPDLDDEAVATGLTLLRSYMVELMHAGVIELRAFQPAFVTQLSERPKISDFAVWQTEAGYDYVNGLTGATISIADDQVRKLIRQADGTRTVEDLKNEMRAELGEESVDEFVETNLNLFLNAGLLIS